MTEHIQVVPDKCRACRRCEVACIAAHHGMSFKEAMKHRDELVSRVQVVKADGFKTTVRCHQCPHAPCVNVCPTGALQQDEKGRIIMRVQYCVACKMCMAACPYGTITMETIGMPSVDGEDGETIAQRARREVAVRCDMCRAWRMENGKRITACMEACPAHALSLVLADGTVVEVPKPEKKAVSPADGDAAAKPAEAAKAEAAAPEKPAEAPKSEPAPDAAVASPKAETAAEVAETKAEAAPQAVEAKVEAAPAVKPEEQAALAEKPETEEAVETKVQEAAPAARQEPVAAEAKPAAAVEAKAPVQEEADAPAADEAAKADAAVEAAKAEEAPEAESKPEEAPKAAAAPQTTAGAALRKPAPKGGKKNSKKSGKK